jgi:hypothetical protein
VRIAFAILLGLALFGGAALAAEETAPDEAPVKIVAAPLITVRTDAGTGILPGYVSGDWSVPEPGITRAVLVFHGRLRNADVYWRSAQKALAASGAASNTLMIVPQFLADGDVRAHGAPADFLHWNWTGWEGGSVANGPIAISSFEAIDAILVRLADRALFPNLKIVVVSGHSGGAQIVQRYAVVGRGEDALAKAGVHVRYVVANPSSYLYFDAARPVAVGASCPDVNQWKYGWPGAPAYAQAQSPQGYEAGFVRRDVVYLLGTADTNPDHPALDKSCAGEAQGPYRYARGLAYFDYLHKRNPTMTAQRMVRVEGIGHDGDAMFTSACGLSVLFDSAGCARP